MAEKTPVGLEGQIRTPNPIELFWERNRRGILTGGVLAVLAIAAVYGLQYIQARAVDERWSGFATRTGLDKGYSEDGSLAGLVRGQGRDPRTTATFFNYYINSARSELVSELPEDIGSVTRSEIEQQLTTARGTETEPLLLWISAHRALFDKDWDGAAAHLDELERKFPGHFLCAKTEYPVQFRSEKDKPKDNDKDKNASGGSSTQKANEKPDLESATKGSAVSLFRARLERERQFRQQHSALYTPPEPPASPTVVVKLQGDHAGEIKIRLYREAAPKHVDNFLQLCKDGTFFIGQRIHFIQRPAADAERGTEQLQFGLPGSKEPERTKWEPSPERKKIDFEDNDLSHFPGMVAAVAEDEGKSSAERIWINASDCASEADGTRVIFGRVVEGLDLVRDICQATFENEEMRRAGQGRPQATITIESVTVVE
jgi:cyclophilin family peptidyl-prolyl cis-trans isomerase